MSRRKIPKKKHRGANVASRLTEKEFRDLKREAKERKIKISSYIRECIRYRLYIRQTADTVYFVD